MIASPISYLKWCALDPATHGTGYALGRTCPKGRNLVISEAGLFTPAKDPTDEWNVIERMSQDLSETLDDYRPDMIVIELSSGHVNTKRHKGGGAGLPKYGTTCGYLWRDAVAWAIVKGSVIPVCENAWTRGRSKKSRMIEAATLYAPYATCHDPEGDRADALTLLAWAVEAFRETKSADGVRRLGLPERAPKRGKVKL